MKESEDPKNSENGQEEKSEEFLNFEKGLERVLSLSKEELEQIRRRVPYNSKDGPPKQQDKTS